MFKYALSLCLALVAPSLAGIVSYEADSFPEDVGWHRSDRLHLADRWIEDGRFVQYAEVVDPGVPEDDYYRRYIAEFTGAEGFFVEWVVETDGAESFADVAPVCLTVSGRLAVMYHFTIAKDQVLFRRDPYIPSVWVDIEPDVAHTYRLEMYGEQSYLWYIDGQLVDSGIPEGPYPTEDSRIVFGARASMEASTTRWDYVRFGHIPAHGSGDYNSDEDVDGGDFYFFHECLTNRRPGINGGPDQDAGPGCRFADFDDDTDVDLLDIAEFQLIFTGGE